MQPTRREARHLAIGAGLAVLTLVAYARVAGNGFVSYDDNDYATENPVVRAGLTWNGLIWAFTTGHSANWHPLTWLSHMLDGQLFGMSPAGHHGTSLALHVVTAVLLFQLLLRTTRSTWPSAFVAAVFALHPLHVQSVAWVAERKDVLSGLFFVATLLAYVRWVESPTRGRRAAMLALYALGLMSKPMLVTLPFVLMLLDLWPLGRVEVRGWGSLVREKIPLFALALASCVATFVVQRSIGAMTAGSSIPLATRAGNALLSYAAYLGKSLWPSPLSAFYPYPLEIPALHVLVALAVLGAVTLYAWTRRYALVGWLWYLGTLVPVIGLVQVGEQALADRYTYLPLIGVTIAVAWAAAEIAGREPRARAPLAALGVAAVVAMTAATWREVGLWKDDRTRFGHDADAIERNHLAHGILGLVHLREASLAEAEAELRASIAIQPGYPQGHANLGVALELSGRTEEALFEYREAIRWRPAFLEARYNLGLLLLKTGRAADAVPHLEEAIRLRPDWPQARERLEAARAAATKRP